MRRFLGMLTIALAVMVCGGCGYRIGSLAHPQLKTVGIAPVENETVEYGLAAQVRGLLCERFMTDGSLKLVNEKEADCIVYARITSVKFSEVSWSKNGHEKDDFYLPNEWTVTLTIQYSVIIPGRAKPLIEQRVTTGTADFETGPDQMIGRMNGIKQAAYAAAKNVVAGVTEGW